MPASVVTPRRKHLPIHIEVNMEVIQALSARQSRREYFR